MSDNLRKKPELRVVSVCNTPRGAVSYSVTARLTLRLYVVGYTPKSLTAINNLKKVCEEHLAVRYTMEVIDLLTNPRLVTGDEILPVSTLVHRLPPPLKRIIENLSDTHQVLVGLDIKGSEEMR